MEKKELQRKLNKYLNAKKSSKFDGGTINLHRDEAVDNFRVEWKGAMEKEITLRKRLYQQEQKRFVPNVFIFTIGNVKFKMTFSDFAKMERFVDWI